MTLNQAAPLLVAFCALAIVLAGLSLYRYNRRLFEQLALSAFLLAQKKLGSVEGQELMSEAILILIDLLPAGLKGWLQRYADREQITLHELTHRLAQAVYDRLIAPLKPAQS